MSNTIIKSLALHFHHGVHPALYISSGAPSIWFTFGTHCTLYEHRLHFWSTLHIVRTQSPIWYFGSQWFAASCPQSAFVEGTLVITMVSIRLRFVHSDHTNKGKLFHCHSPPVNVGSPFVPQTIHTFDQHLTEIKSSQGCDASWGQLNNHGAPIRSEGTFAN